MDRNVLNLPLEIQSFEFNYFQLRIKGAREKFRKFDLSV